MLGTGKIKISDGEEPEAVASITRLILSESLNAAQSGAWDEGVWLFLDLTCSLLLLLKSDEAGLKTALSTCALLREEVFTALNAQEGSDIEDAFMDHFSAVLATQLSRSGVLSMLSDGGLSRRKTRAQIQKRANSHSSRFRREPYTVPLYENAQLAEFLGESDGEKTNSARKIANLPTPARASAEGELLKNKSILTPAIFSKNKRPNAAVLQAQLQGEVQY